MTQRIDDPDRSCPAKLMRPQFAEAMFGAAMGDQNRGVSQSVTAAAHGAPDFEIVREAIPERWKTPDFFQDPSPERDGRAEARMCQPRGCPKHGIRKELIIDPHSPKL